MPKVTAAKKRIVNRPTLTELVTLKLERRRKERETAEVESSHDTQRVQPVSSQPTSSIERLPGELLNQVYEEIGFTNKRLSLRFLLQPALTIAIPNLAETYHAMFFAQNKFTVSIYANAKASGRLLAPERAKEHGDIYGVGKLAIPPSGWLRKRSRENADSIRFRDIYLEIFQVDGYPLATIYIKSRQRNGPGSSVFFAKVKDKTTEFSKMIKEARVQAHAEHTDADYAGISLAQLDLVAACFS